MKTFITSQFSYCPLIWMFHSNNVNIKINRIHKRALRLVYQNNLNFFELFDLDNSETVHQKNLQVFVTEVYKVKNGIASDIMMMLMVWWWINIGCGPAHIRLGY